MKNFDDGISKRVRELLNELYEHTNGGFVLFMADSKGNPKCIEKASTPLTKQGLCSIIETYLNNQIIEVEEYEEESDDDEEDL